MGSNILNMYHQAPYRNIGHKVLRATSESGTSESSCTQNSPQKTNDDSDDGEYWDDKQQVWSQNEQVNITKTNHDVSFDDEPIDVQNVSVDESSPEQDDSSDESGDCTSLVEGDDYDIIQVIAVDPDLDLASSDEEQEEGAGLTVDEYTNPEDDYRIDNNKVDLLGPNDLGINLDAPVVSNVDEYFIENDNKILEAKDEPVVKDVDEYFIKEPVVAPNVVEDRPQYDQGIDFRITESKPIVDSPVKTEPMKKETECINNSDLEGLSNIEYLKNFILDDLQNDRFRIVPRSQNSVSLPQTPMHNICMDIDAKTCFSFEDLDLNDLSFENFKDKSTGSNKNDDIPRTLTDEEINSFLITDKKREIKQGINDNVDDLTHQDMEIEKPLDSIIKCIAPPEIVHTIPENIPERSSTPLPKSVLDFCIEKSIQSPLKSKVSPVKLEIPDFVDIETCNEINVPVLKASNLNSLLEQFEASEKLTEPVVPGNKNLKPKISSRTRLQDAGIQLNKNKMRHILMPSTVNATITRSPSPIHADHDYCSTKKRHSTNHLKGGRSLLKPDVLSSNNEILNSRHRSCRNKKIVYNLSSDDESDNKDKKKLSNRVITETDLKTKKPDVKISKSSIKSKTIRKKEDVFSKFGVLDSSEKSNGSVIVESATKASDIYSQNSSGSLKLIIKNKSEVIINNVDVKDNKNDNLIEKQVDSSIRLERVHKKSSSIGEKSKKLDRFENKDINNQVNTKRVEIKDVNSNPENFYTALFDEKDVQIPQNILVQIKEETKVKVEENIVEQQPAKKKKLNLQEYKLRRGVNSNASSAQVSPESIFPETPNLQLESRPTSSQNNIDSSTLKKEQSEETPKTIFDPIREASRKIIMISKKQKVDAMRKKEEELLMRNIGKVETLEIQPLISDSEMMKIIGMTPEVVPVLIVEKVPAPADYDEVVLVSVGTNTDENMFKVIPNSPERNKRKCESPPAEKKSNINFKIRKNEQLLKHNVFDSHRKENGLENREHHTEGKIDKERYKDIKAALKSVEKQVETKISNNSLFASIQDVVMKKAPSSSSPCRESHKQKRNASAEKSPKIKTTIVREYDVNAEHGEDKVILHLKKNTEKPKKRSECCQTDSTDPKTPGMSPVQSTEVAPNRSRHDSDMSVSSEEETSIEPTETTPPPQKEAKVAVAKPKVLSNERVQQKDKARVSESRYDSKYRRSRSHSRGRRRNGSPVRRRSGSPRRRSGSPRRRSGSPRRRSGSPSHRRSVSPRRRSRSRDRYRSYRRRESPYRRKRRSRSPYRSRRSPFRRDYKNSRTRSRSRHNNRKKSRTPVPKRQSSPKYNYRASCDKKPVAQPQSARNPTVSECSYSSSVSRSSSLSKSSTSSSSSSSTGSYRKDEGYSNKGYTNSFSSEDRENNTPVEERRIVFVGKLEKDITKGALRSQFSKFGPVTEVRLHSKEDGSRYGFVTYQRPRDAWSAVESASLFPQYDVGFGGRRAFCRQSYADLDGLEAKYTESAFHGQVALPIRRNDDMSFEQMLLDMKNKLNKRKCDKRDDTA